MQMTYEAMSVSEGSIFPLRGETVWLWAAPVIAPLMDQTQTSNAAAAAIA